MNVDCCFDYILVLRGGKIMIIRYFFLPILITSKNHKQALKCDVKIYISAAILVLMKIVSILESFCVLDVETNGGSALIRYQE